MRMVDVTGKDVSARVAVARGSVQTTHQAISLIEAGQISKGDVLSAAQLAGIMAVKRTADLLPLCHPIAIGAADVELRLDPEGSIQIEATVKTADRTGVEMEALTSVSVAALTIIDMIKSVDPAASIEHVRVDLKTGGKTGDWYRPQPETSK